MLKMASAYASLVSLVHVLNRVQHPTCPASFDQLQVQSLLDKVNSLVDFLEAYSHRITDGFGRKMVHAAYAAEDMIETYITDRILQTSSCDTYAVLFQDLEKAIHDMSLNIQEAMKVKEKNKYKEQVPVRYLPVESSVAPSAMVKMVGRDDEFNRLMEQLTADQSRRQTIPIVGMGGIGKTTLATNIYNYPGLRNHFDVKAWITISQEFTVGKIIRLLLCDLGVRDMDSLSDNEVGDQLHKCLFSRRYLVILDNIWDVKAWEEISIFCPDNNNKSRILLTTRISDFGRSVGSSSPFYIKLLDYDKSWELLSAKVFGAEACPPELEECGKKISNSCKGLPLSIVVNGGLLKTVGKTRKYWDDIVQNIRNFKGREDDEYCLKILSLSYHQLPIHLKPCFLYLATYPYDSEICVAEIIRLWVADGFLRLNSCDATLEEVALKYLKELINRNLIMIKKLKFTGEMKRLNVHDLVMDLCVQEVRKERFLYVDHGGEKPPYEIESQRRLVFHGSDHTSTQHKGFSRSYILFGGWDPSDISHLRLLRSCVFSGYVGREYLAPLVNLRLLEFPINLDNADWFKKTSKLWNLETLKVSESDSHFDLQPEIWNLRHIKHLIFPERVTLPDPPTFDADFAFQNLQILTGVQILGDRVLDMIPNIKKMSIHYEHHEDAELLHGFNNLAHCHKLEMLEISMLGCMDLKKIKFPHSLRKLTLWSCDFPWEKCGVGLLPNLEYFRLVDSPFDDGTWNTVEEEFQKLKTLSLFRCNLSSWTADDCCPFPSLERLHILEELYLEEIPEVFEESTTLEEIKLRGCSHDAVMSAKRILDEQQSQGSYDLTVYIDQYATDYTEEMRLDLLSLKTDKFLVTFLT